MIRFIARALGANYSSTFFNYFIMLPKTRKELREIFTKLNAISLNEDLLKIERNYICSALRHILCADYYVAHTSKSHKQLKAEENENA